jgi:hypothetical protein
MANPISSNWTGASAPTQTWYQTGQTLAQWIDAHVSRAESNGVAEPPVPPDPIVTTWTSGGQPITVSTPQEPPETAEHWLARHFDRVRAKMDSDPPDKN